MNARDSPDDDAAQRTANRYCAGARPRSARDRWLGTLYASAEFRDALCALTSSTTEIRQASKRATIPVWRRYGLLRRAKRSPANGVTKRPATRSRSPFPPPSRLCAAAAWLEAMLNSRLKEIAAEDDFDLRRVSRLRRREQGARLRLAALNRGRGGRI